MRGLNLIVLGTAGAGKTALTKSFGSWISENTDQRVAYVNLDPGCDAIPFPADFDIREHFTVSRIMREENLGPNGAMVRAAELLELNVAEFSKRINEIQADVRLIDTPGQMEVFLFHGGSRMMELLKGTSIALFLLDAKVATRAAGLVFSRLLELSIALRLGSPTICVLNKIDLVREKLPDIDRMATSPEALRDRLTREESGVNADLMLSLSEVLPRLLPAARLVKTSATAGEGMRELYDIVHEVFCACGDLT